MFQEECAVNLENIPYGKLHPCKQKHSYSKPNCKKCGLLAVPSTVSVQRDAYPYSAQILSWANIQAKEYGGECAT